MRLSDFMSRDTGNGCRAFRRNDARSAFRSANGGRALNLPAPVKQESRAAAFVRHAVQEMMRPAPASLIAKVANLDDERAARKRAAMDRKNAAARAKRKAA